MLLALARSMDETMHLRILAHARRELGTQVNEGLLRGGRCAAAAGPLRAQGPAWPRPGLTGPRPAPPRPRRAPPGPAPPCPHRAGPDPKVLLLHVLDILVDPTVAQYLGGGEKDKTELSRAPSRQSGREGAQTS